MVDHMKILFFNFCGPSVLWSILTVTEYILNFSKSMPVLVFFMLLLVIVLFIVLSSKDKRKAYIYTYIYTYICIYININQCLRGDRDSVSRVSEVWVCDRCLSVWAWCALNFPSGPLRVDSGLPQASGHVWQQYLASAHTLARLESERGSFGLQQVPFMRFILLCPVCIPTLAVIHEGSHLTLDISCSKVENHIRK